jgi:hypothetical protein
MSDIIMSYIFCRPSLRESIPKEHRLERLAGGKELELLLGQFDRIAPVVDLARIGAHARLAGVAGEFCLTADTRATNVANGGEYHRVAAVCG